MSAPSKLTEENRLKLKEAAALDASVEEMAYLCDVTFQTVYNWFKAEPELFEEIQRLRLKPVLKARKAAVEKATDSYGNAVDYLKRKKRDEFGDNIDHTTGGEPLNITFDNSFEDESS